MEKPDRLVRRLSKAHSKNSLREIADLCGVSHQLIFKILQTESISKISMRSYEKISKGLRENGL